MSFVEVDGGVLEDVGLGRRPNTHIFLTKCLNMVAKVGLFLDSE